SGAADAFAIGRAYDAVIAPFAGGAILPAAYAGARASDRPFILWASVWAQPRSLAHALALPVTRRIYQRADAVLAYGEHVRRCLARSCPRPTRRPRWRCCPRSRRPGSASPGVSSVTRRCTRADP